MQLIGWILIILAGIALLTLLIGFMGACCDGGNYDEWIEGVYARMQEEKSCHPQKNRCHQKF